VKRDFHWLRDDCGGGGLFSKFVSISYLDLALQHQSTRGMLFNSTSVHLQFLQSLWEPSQLLLFFPACSEYKQGQVRVYIPLVESRHHFQGWISRKDLDRGRTGNV
jgi:hypothetical protein